AEHHHSFCDSIEQKLEQHLPPQRDEAALAAFNQMIEGLAAGVEARPVAETLRAVLASSGYQRMLEEEGTEEAQSRLANLDELLNAATDASERGENLRDFLDHAA